MADDTLYRRENGDHIVAMEMDPERRARFKRLAEEIVDLMKPHTSPLEAYAILRMLVDSMEETYDFAGTFHMGRGSEKTQ